jgi:hypothetical protein
MLHQAGQPNTKDFSVAQNGSANLNNQMPLVYGDALRRIYQNGASNSAPGFPPMAKGLPTGQTHDNPLMTSLNNTGLELTVDQAHNNQYTHHQNHDLHQSNNDASANISHPEVKQNLEWNHPSGSGPSGQVNLEDVSSSRY